MKTLLKTIGIVSTLIGSSFLFQNCSEKESIPEGIIPPTDSVSSKIEIKNFSIEAQIHTSPDSTVTMQGERNRVPTLSYRKISSPIHTSYGSNGKQIPVDWEKRH